jgi:hypothetical protein
MPVIFQYKLLRFTQSNGTDSHVFSLSFVLVQKIISTRLSLFSGGGIFDRLSISESLK